MSFPDHHPFTKSEMETIINGHTNQILFITTEKDYFRMNQLFPSSFMECIYVLAIQLSVPEKEIESILHSIMND